MEEEGIGIAVRKEDKITGEEEGSEGGREGERSEGGKVRGGAK